MTEDEQTVVQLRDGFYRDDFGKLTFLIVSVLIAIGLLVAMSLALMLRKPPPVTFHTDAEWRVLPPVAIDKSYLSDPELLQWISNLIPDIFTYDFVHYNDQLKKASQYFTPEGWKVFQNQLNIYANYNNVQSYRLFITGTMQAAPSIVDSGALKEKGAHGWWVEMPVTLTYTGGKTPESKLLSLRVLIIRVSTLNNLDGVAIDNVVVTNGMQNQRTGTG